MGVVQLFEGCFERVVLFFQFSKDTGFGLGRLQESLRHCEEPAIWSLFWVKY